MKNFKVHAILILFLTFLFYCLFHEVEFEFNFWGTNLAFIMSTIFSISYLSKPVQIKPQFYKPYFNFIKFHWPSLALMCISISGLISLVLLFGILLRELLLYFKCLPPKNTKENLFYRLSILQPQRKSGNIFLLSLIFIFPAWIFGVFPEFTSYLMDIKYNIVFFLFSICYSNQLLQVSPVSLLTKDDFRKEK